MALLRRFAAVLAAVVVAGAPAETCSSGSSSRSCQHKGIVLLQSKHSRTQSPAASLVEDPDPAPARSPAASLVEDPAPAHTGRPPGFLSRSSGERAFSWPQAPKRRSALQRAGTLAAESLQPSPPFDLKSAQLEYNKQLKSFWVAALFLFAVTVALVVGFVAACLPTQVVKLGPAEKVEDELSAQAEDLGWFDTFRSPTLEQRWLRESYDATIAGGARMLLCATLGYIVYRSIRLAKRWDPDSCLPFSGKVAALEFTFLGLAFGASAVCAHRPGAIYWPLLLFFFFYILASTLPPFAFSCTELAHQCAHSTDPYVQEASRHADCTLEGYTAQQTIMTWILMLPWVVPRSSLMPLVWAWLLMTYGGWTLLYRYHVNAAFQTFSLSALQFHLALLSLTLAISTREKVAIERMHRAMFRADLRIKEASFRLFQILKYMVPLHVIQPMITQQPGEVIAEQVERATVLFVLIDGFDEVAEKRTPSEVLEFLNEYFTYFDEICEQNRVTKIETVGEEYVCCVGVMPEDKAEQQARGHSVILNRLLRAADQMLQLQKQDVRFKMGMHSGSVVAGVIGRRLPRYRLFGDTMNTAARMMQKGQVGQIQFGEETFHELPDGVPAQPRGEIELKGKGQVKAYLCQKATEDGAPPPTLRPKHQSVFASMLEGAEEPEQEDEEVTYTYQPDPNASAPQPRLEVPDHDGEFEKVLAATKPADTHLEGAALDAWKTWHHTSKVCSKFGPSLDAQLAILLTLTLVEALYMLHHGEQDRTNRGIPGKYRVPLFVACRAVVLVIILGWRLIANTSWFKENGDSVMWMRTASWVVIAVVLFISYDDLTPDDVALVKEGHALVEIAPFSQNFSLVFVLVYTMVTRLEGILFLPSLIFVPLAIALMANAQYEQNENVVASIPAKVFFTVNALVSSAICHTDEQTSRLQYKAKTSVESTTARVQGILSTLMPPLVLEELRTMPSGQRPTHSYKVATLCQSDLCGFTQLSAKRSPWEVVSFMGDLFGMFDELTGEYGVYKVETVGDAYIAGTAEAPLTPTNSPKSVILFGLAMVEAVHTWSRNLGVSVSCRVGVHHGDCIGGVVGRGMQRYHLFGKLLCGMEILESTAPQGYVQVSRVVKQAVEREGAQERFLFKDREEPHLKTSKGLIYEYDSVGGRSMVVTLKDGGKPSP